MVSERIQKHNQYVDHIQVLEANAQTLTLKSSLPDEIGEMLTSVENHHSSQQNDGGVIDSSSSNTYSEDIESEANSYFQRMLAEQHSIDDEMVQMLTRFKESSMKREQSIFDCMIFNLLEEYMFLPKYPEKQLELAAILFGCIIKHQLVTHLPLGIALRCVLDALHKPADSKMFAFGTKALEQFISRLEEWPQYCSHILQITHLRSTHPKVVEYIDGVLARKSHGGNGNMSSLGTTVNELIGSNSSQPGQQLSSSLWFDPLQSALVEDGTKASTTTNSFTKPPIAASVQPSATSSADSVSLPKLQSAQSPPGGVLSISSGFSRNQGSTTRFCSALNIKTLEAAAERRETPTESIVPKMGEYGGENVTSCYEDEKTIKNVGESEVTVREPRMSTDDNAPRLDQDVSANRAWPLLLSANKDANGREIRMRRDTTTTPNYGKASLSLPRSSINESIHERWNVDSAPRARSQSLGNENWRIASLCSARPLQRVNVNESLVSSTDATPRNYGRMPLMMDFYADNVSPLPSVNEDAYGGGFRSSRITTYSCGTDATPRNYGRMPLIMDFYADNLRPLPSVNEDAYGGGGRMSRFTTNYNYGRAPPIRENFSTNSVRPLPSVPSESSARPLQSGSGNHSCWSSSSTDATPRNYGRTPLIMDFYADNVRPLPSVNEDAYGGGGRMSRFTTNYNYGRAPPIRENFSTNSVRPLPSVPSESSAWTLHSGSGNHSLRSSSSTDATPRNYGRTPLIMDFYADNVRPLPSINEDAYGGGVRMSGLTTTHNYGMQPLIRENISSNSVRPLPSVANNEKASLISDEFAVINITRPLSSINEPLYEWWNSDLKASKPQRVSPSRDSTSTPHNYGKAPMIEDFIADSASPRPPVHPTQQKSTRPVNSSFGSCFPWFRKRMQSGLLKKK